MNSSPVPRRRKAARRAEILAAASEVFSAKAYEEASISEIASRADCVEGTIYTYFRGKRDLFDAVLGEFYDRLIGDIEPRFQAIQGTSDRLRFLIARHLQIAVDDPGIARMIRRESRGPASYFGSKLHALNRQYSRFLLRTIADGVARGDLRADLDQAVARDLVFGGLDHWIWSELGRHRSIDPVRSADAMVRTLLGGWQGDSAAAVSAATAPLDDLRRRVERLEAKAHVHRGRGAS